LFFLTNETEFEAQRQVTKPSATSGLAGQRQQKHRTKEQTRQGRMQAKNERHRHKVRYLQANLFQSLSRD